MKVKNDIKKTLCTYHIQGNVLNDIPPLSIQDDWLLKINMNDSFNHRNLDNFVGQSSSIRVFREHGDHEVFSDKDLDPIHKFLEINK